MIAKRMIWVLAILAAGGLSLAWTNSASAGWGYRGGGVSFSIQTPRAGFYYGSGPVRTYRPYYRSYYRPHYHPYYRHYGPAYIPHGHYHYRGYRW